MERRKAACGGKRGCWLALGQRLKAGRHFEVLGGRALGFHVRLPPMRRALLLAALYSALHSPRLRNLPPAVMSGAWSHRHAASVSRRQGVRRGFVGALLARLWASQQPWQPALGACTGFREGHAAAAAGCRRVCCFPRPPRTTLPALQPRESSKPESPTYREAVGGMRGWQGAAAGTFEVEDTQIASPCRACLCASARGCPEQAGGVRQITWRAVLPPAACACSHGIVRRAPQGRLSRVRIDENKAEVPDDEAERLAQKIVEVCLQPQAAACRQTAVVCAAPACPPVLCCRCPTPVLGAALRTVDSHLCSVPMQGRIGQEQFVEVRGALMRCACCGPSTRCVGTSLPSLPDLHSSCCCPWLTVPACACACSNGSTTSSLLCSPICRTSSAPHPLRFGVTPSPRQNFTLDADGMANKVMKVMRSGSLFTKSIKAMTGAPPPFARRPAAPKSLAASHSSLLRLCMSLVCAVARAPYPTSMPLLAYPSVQEAARDLGSRDAKRQDGHVFPGSDAARAQAVKASKVYSPTDWLHLLQQLFILHAHVPGSDAGVGGGRGDPGGRKGSVWVPMCKHRRRCCCRRAHAACLCAHRSHCTCLLCDASRLPFPAQDNPSSPMHKVAEKGGVRWGGWAGERVGDASLLRDLGTNPSRPGLPPAHPLSARNKMQAVGGAALAACHWFDALQLLLNPHLQFRPLAALKKVVRRSVQCRLPLATALSPPSFPSPSQCARRWRQSRSVCGWSRTHSWVPTQVITIAIAH